jgi:sterol desaturase/sphingolipid hydroxylase (fatty acid hydroxylase superfamily)
MSNSPETPASENIRSVWVPFVGDVKIANEHALVNLIGRVILCLILRKPYYHESVEDNWYDVFALIIRVCYGILLYTLIEYVLHYMAHNSYPTYKAGHMHHHARPNDLKTTVMREAVFAVLVSILEGMIFVGVISSVVGNVMFLCYIAYEIQHFCIHNPNPIVPFELNHWHTMHHINPRIGYGVSTPLWDVVFGTCPIDIKPHVEMYIPFIGWYQ